MPEAIAIDLIQFHENTQPRVKQTEHDVAADYAKAMVEGREFPPVDVFFDGAEYWLADGYHRLTAAESLGLAEIECEIHYGTLSDAIWFSCSVNAAHGLRRTRDDVQLAIQRALAHPKSAGRSDRELAAHVGCSDKTIAAVRQRMVVTAEIPQLQSRVDKNGVERVVPVKPAAPRTPVQLDIEDAIGGTPVDAPEPVQQFPVKPAFDQTWWFIATRAANVLREQRGLPDARTAALNFPRDQAAALSLEDAEHMAAWWAEFLPLFRGRQAEFAEYRERERARISAKLEELNRVA